jgi:hypothetical protein
MTGYEKANSCGNQEVQHRESYICQIPTFNFTFSDVPKAFGTGRKFHNGLINCKNGNFRSFVGTESYVIVFLREIKHDLVCRAP